VKQRNFKRPRTNVTQRARTQSCLDDAEVTVQTQKDNLGAGGALSYLLGSFNSVRKIDAGRDLLLAVDAVLRGEQFISSSNGFEFTDT